MPVIAGAARRAGSDRPGLRRPPPVALTAVPRRRKAKRLVGNRQRVVAVAVGFIAVLSIGMLLTGYGPFFWSNPSMQSALPFQQPQGFARTRVGDVMMPTGQGNTCRRTPFFNDTGLFGPDQTVRCDTGAPPNAADTPGARAEGESGRLLQLRDSFKR